MGWMGMRIAPRLVDNQSPTGLLKYAESEREHATVAVAVHAK